MQGWQHIQHSRWTCFGVRIHRTLDYLVNI